MSNERMAIGIDLGGTQIKAVLITESGEILKTRLLDTYVKDDLSTGDQHWKKEVARMVQELTGTVNNIDAIGLSAPGLSDSDNASIAFMPGRLQGLENFKWAEIFNHSSVKVINDAHAALIAESKLGAGRGTYNQLMITLGTGVGGALMIDGKLYQGFLQRAGHVGHMSLDTEGSTGILDIPGTLEEAFGNASVVKRSHGRFTSCQQMAEAYVRGDTLATYFWLNAVQKLSLGLVSLVNIISPELIILGGGITNAKSALMDPLKEFMALYEWRPGGRQTIIKLSEFNEFSGAVGAALYSLTNKPEKSAE